MARPKTTVCRKGLHDMTNPANVMERSDGGRQCRPCHTAAKNAYSKKKRREANMEKYGVPLINPPATGTTCAVESCDRPRAAHTEQCKGRYCFAHEVRLNKHGDLFVDVPIGAALGSRGLAAKRAELLAAQNAEQAHAEQVRRIARRWMPAEPGA